MSTQSFRSLLATTILLVTVPAMAHDPGEHMAATEQPDCTVMDDRGHDGMDTNDPVVQAMMKKCMGSTHKEGMSTKREPSQSPAPDELVTEEGHSHDHLGG